MAAQQLLEVDSLNLRRAT